MAGQPISLKELPPIPATWATIGLLFPSWAFRRVAREVLLQAGIANHASVLNEAWKRLAEEPRRPWTSPGVEFLILYLRRAASLYEELRSRGWSEARAGELLHVIQWRLFGPLTELLGRVSRLRSKKRMTRLDWILAVMFATVFTKPFRRNVLPDAQGLAFDVVRCPVADYLRTRNVSELTPWVACNLDFRMAQQWHVTLSRVRTIATGHELCDFRFRAVPTDGHARLLLEKK